LDILVVDDEKDANLLFKQNFKEEVKRGLIKFHFALSGEEALQLLQKNLSIQLVLILSDINMPDMSGLDLLKLIKKNYPHLTVFILTVYGDALNCQLVWEYGAEEIINKPLNFAYLKKLVLDFANRYKLKENG
jgi:DNA-binding NtrC family response regulator